MIALLKVFTRPQAHLAGVRAVGDPVAVLPVLFPLLWTRKHAERKSSRQVELGRGLLRIHHNLRLR